MKFAVALFLFAFAFSAFAEPPGRVGRISIAEGDVRFARDSGESAEAVINTPVTSGDSLRTGAASRAEIQIGSATLHLGENSRLHFTRLGDDAVRVYLIEGAMIARVRDTSSSFELSAPRLIVSFPSPGIYRVDVEDGVTGISVREGAAEVTRSTGERFSVARNESARVAARERHSIRYIAARDRLDEWSNTRQKLEENAISSRYLSRELTGYQDLDQYGEWEETIEYGPVWMPYAVSSGWAPYRYGHWSFVHPWGWTWIDHAPWGFAPFHYGRWVHRHKVWCWVPGPFVKRPHFAPALVTFGHGHKHHEVPKVWQPLPPDWKHTRVKSGMSRHAMTREKPAGFATASSQPNLHQPASRHRFPSLDAASRIDSRERTRVESGRIIPENFGRMRPAPLPRAHHAPSEASKAFAFTSVPAPRNHTSRGVPVR
jgi:hypothetical protein